jgi:hypothetical protein
MFKNQANNAQKKRRDFLVPASIFMVYLLKILIIILPAAVSSRSGNHQP